MQDRDVVAAAVEEIDDVDKSAVDEVEVAAVVEDADRQEAAVDDVEEAKWLLDEVLVITARVATISDEELVEATWVEEEVAVACVVTA